MAVAYVPYAGPIVTRAEAKAAGLKRYFDGVPCKAGHLAQRLVSSQQCICCNYAYKKPGVPESWKAARAAWKLANIERVREMRRLGYQRRKERELASSRAWKEANKVKVRIYGSTRRARKLASAGTHSAADVKDILVRQRFRCAYCRVKLGKVYDVDHIVAIASGGSNDRRNIQITCRNCNARKSDIDPIVFVQRKGMLI